LLYRQAYGATNLLKVVPAYPKKVNVLFETRSLVSVVITCYNQEAYMADAINSVLSQTYPSWECLIIDDGSTDGSAAICKQFAEQDSRIKYIYQPNAGVSLARNLGFSNSKGEYIQFLDGDDFIREEKLALQVEILENNPEVAVSYTNHQHLWQASGNLAQYTFDVLREKPLEQLLSKYDQGVSIPVHTALIRKNIWHGGELPFVIDFQHRYEDWIFWVRIALKNVRFAFLDRNLAVYRIHSQSFTASSSQLAFNALQAVFYISRILPDDLRSRFEHCRIEFILSRYHDQQVQQLSETYMVKRLIAPFTNFIQKIKHKLSWKSGG
jgi:glycosyltransferase involved in cell wall biosynthesis